MSHQYRRRSGWDRRRPRVLDVAPGLVHDSGPIRDRAWAPERVAVMAHWSADPEPTRSVVATLVELDAAGYETVLVSAAEVPGPLRRVCSWAPGGVALPERTTILRRANVGYDFGSWAAAFSAFPGVRRADRVLLVNDSVIGPLSSLTPALEDFEASGCPVWGLVGSNQHRPHLQSFFMGFKEGVLDLPALRQFWSDVRVERRKSKVVRYGELGLSEALEDAGIGWMAMRAVLPQDVANPTLGDPEQLLEAGIPFLKANAPLGQDRVRHLRQGQWINGPASDPDATSGPGAFVSRGRFLLDIEGARGALVRLRRARESTPRRG